MSAKTFMARKIRDVDASCSRAFRALMAHQFGLRLAQFGGVVKQTLVRLDGVRDADAGAVSGLSPITLAYPRGLGREFAFRLMRR